MELFTPLIFSILMLLMPQQTINPGSVTIVGNATAANQTNASQKTQIVDGSGNVIGATSNKLDVNCASGCTGGTTDTDDGSVAGGQSTGLQIGEVYMWNGSAWVRLLGDATNGLKVNLAATAANTTAIKVDGSAVTQPVSGTVTVTDGAGALNVIVDSGTITLPSGASTAAKQPALGTAGTASADVITVQGAASMTKLLVTPDANSAVNVAQVAGGTTATVGTGVQKVAIVDSNGNPITNADVVHVIADSGTITTVSTVTNVATIGTSVTPGTAAANLGKAEDAVAGSGDTGVAALAVIETTPSATAANGDYVHIKTNANGVLWSQPISVGANAATKPSNSEAMGAAGVTSEQTAVTNGQLTNLVSDLVGKLIVLPYANPENFVQGVTAAITDTTSTSVIASAGGSLRNYITHCTVSNSHATVGTFVKILDGTTIIDEVYAAAAGGGGSLTYPVPLRGTAATAINAQPVTTGSNVIVACNGYKGL